MRNGKKSLPPFIEIDICQGKFQNVCSTLKDSIALLKSLAMKPFLQPVLYFLFSVLFLSLSCKKPKTEEKPEAVTIEGKTFGCKVDGQLFLPEGYSIGSNTPPINVNFWYNPVTGKKKVIAHGKKGNRGVEVYINSPVTIGRKPLNTTTRSYPTNGLPPDYGMYYENSGQTEYITNGTVGGWVDVLVADTLTNKIEARFEFTGTDRTTGKQITVTKGYFKNF